MALHDSLRDLVTVRGAGVVDEAEEFRGVLDDFLAEDEATLGELNLLVDAVRLGALRRVLDVMAHGAAPEAAVREAGAQLARDRGTDDPARSCWALATLCFALGRVDASMVRMFRGDAGTMSVPGPPAASGPPAAPVLSGPGTAERPQTQVLRDDAAPAQGSPPPAQPASPTVDVRPAPPAPYGGPVPPVIPEERSSRAGVVLLVLLVALILGGLVAAGVILLQSDDDGEPAAGNGGDGGDGGNAALVPDSAMLVPYKEGDDSRVYQVDTAGGWTALTPEGVDARLPTIAPDRRTMTYQDYTDAEPGQPGVLMRFDLETQEAEPFFEDGDCARSLRPGWSLDGSRIAVICMGDDDVPEGIYVADADGSGTPTLVVEDSLVRGSPTWTSGSQFVYGTYADSEDDPLQFQLIDADIGGDPVRLPAPADGKISHPDWSEEAGKLLFLVSPNDSDQEIGDIWIMNADGTGQTLLAEGEFAHPVWAPDGSAIGVTLEDDTVLGYVPYDESGDAVVVPDPPPGEVGVPVWGAR